MPLAAIGGIPVVRPERPDAAAWAGAATAFTQLSCAERSARNTSFDRNCTSGDIRENFAG